MRKLLPILLALVGLGGGVGAGLALRPAPEPPAADMHAEGDAATGEDAHGAEGGGDHADGGDAAATDGHGESEGAEGEGAEGEPQHEFVKLSNQFLVPIVTDGRIGAVVAMSVSLQVKTGMTETVFAREPKLRDEFLQVLFDHANTGGFNGLFTSPDNLGALRRALLEAARGVIGRDVSDILITDIVRQDS